MRRWLPALLVLLWTNPPDLDLKSIRFFAIQAGASDTMVTEPYFGRCVAVPDTCTPRLSLADRDSVYFALPCFAVPTAWFIWCKAKDWTGNESGVSNIVRAEE